MSITAGARPAQKTPRSFPAARRLVRVLDAFFARFVCRQVRESDAPDYGGDSIASVQATLAESCQQAELIELRSRIRARVAQLLPCCEAGAELFQRYERAMRAIDDATAPLALRLVALRALEQDLER